MDPPASLEMFSAHRSMNFSNRHRSPPSRPTRHIPTSDPCHRACCPTHPGADGAGICGTPGRASCPAFSPASARRGAGRRTGRRPWRAYAHDGAGSHRPQVLRTSPALRFRAAAPADRRGERATAIKRDALVRAARYGGLRGRCLDRADRPRRASASPRARALRPPKRRGRHRPRSIARTARPTAAALAGPSSQAKVGAVVCQEVLPAAVAPAGPVLARAPPGLVAPFAPATAGEFLAELGAGAGVVGEATAGSTRFPPAA